MSPSWLDRLTLLVHPQRLVLERKPWRGAVSRQQADVALPVVGEAAWQPVLATAETLLGTARRGAALRIVIADPFVRYAVLPWSESIIGKPARLAMARALLRNALGERAEILDIALDRPAFGKSGIAAGIDRNLIAALRSLAKVRRLRLYSLQPRLMVELNVRYKQLADGWFACIDEGWLTLVGIREGQISSLRNYRANTADRRMLADELGGLLAAEAMPPGSRKLFVSSREVVLTELAGEWETTHWPFVVEGEAHA